MSYKRTTPRRFPELTPEEAAQHVHHGMTIGFSGFTPAGAAKSIPQAIAARARAEHEAGREFKIGVVTGASTGDSLDGELARLHGPSDRGAFLDIALDFLFYALVPLGFVLADPAQNAVAGAVLIASFIGTGSSFLAFAVIAERRGLTSAAFPKKGIFYLGGLTEGFETIAVFLLMCLFPSAFPVLALIFAAACFVTTALRWWQGWKVFS